jgi:hypothetical protein
VGSEVPAAVEALRSIGSGELIERNSLRSWVDQLDDGPMWNAKARSNFHTAAFQFDYGSIELWHTKWRLL